MAELFRSWGYRAELEEFQVLFPTPKHRRLELVAPTSYVALLSEPPLAQDRTSGQQDEQLPPYNAYSIDGRVEGELVYVNYGVPKDYEELELRGIDVRGKIVLARYGGSWRGVKPKVAAEHGAIGCVIYSDPLDDGYALGDVYPVGGFRNADGAQRGSVLDGMALYAGDPLTPFVGATPEARRLERSQAQTLTKIPTLPISYKDALPLLQALGGPIAPKEWRGALAVPYHLGPGPARVRLELEFDWKLAPIYDVIARLEGAERPDQWIVRGNHHDAWVNGATDPISGLVGLLEEARAVGELARAGWRPKRTIIYAAWDGEEPGLLGSVEWAEAHGEELKDKAVAYINSDSNARGFLSMGGSHTLERFVNQIARDVRDPQQLVSVAERLRARRTFEDDQERQAELRERADLRLDPLGSGSDYTPFLQHLGIAVLDLSYGGEDEYGQYHSIYDSIDHYLRFMDPTLAYGIALAQTNGRALLRLANAEVVPFEFTALADNLALYLEQVTELADQMRERTAETNRRIEHKLYQAYFDPTKRWMVPEPKEPVPHLNLAPLRNALERVRRSAERYAKAWERAEAREGALAPAAQRALDRILMGCERALTRAEGLPGRPWYIHQIYAPGRYTGYGVKTLPGVREAIELRQWSEADQQAEVVAAVLERFAGEVDRASALVEAHLPAR
jgi:N-acetylated-alpha-linked acidic dipeptidase